MKSENKKIIIPCVGVVLIKDDKVLLIKEGEKSHHITGMWGIPAGMLKEGEDEKIAAIKNWKKKLA